MDLVLPEVDTLLHEPARLRVMVVLAMVECADFMWLLRQTGLSRGNLSVQMGRLEQAGMVRADKSVVGGRIRTSYRLTAAGLDALRQYRTAMRTLLAAIPD